VAFCPTVTYGCTGVDALQAFVTMPESFEENANPGSFSSKWNQARVVAQELPATIAVAANDTIRLIFLVMLSLLF
jgi:hypothetical protein